MSYGVSFESVPTIANFAVCWSTEPSAEFEGIFGVFTVSVRNFALFKAFSRST